MFLTDGQRAKLRKEYCRKMFIVADQDGPEQYTWETIFKALILDSVDRFIEHRIKTDKVLIEILKDIQGCQVANRETMEKMMDEFWPAAKKFINGDN